MPGAVARELSASSTAGPCGVGIANWPRVDSIPSHWKGTISYGTGCWCSKRRLCGPCHPMLLRVSKVTNGKTMLPPARSLKAQLTSSSSYGKVCCD